MKNVKIISGIVVMAVSAIVAAPHGEAAGLLGKRYAGATFEYVDFDDTSIDARGVNGFVNVPVTGNLDFGLDFGLGDVEDLDFWSANGSATWHIDRGSFKPFAGVSLGYADIESIDGDWLWGVHAGVEVPVGARASVAPFVAYNDGFDGQDGSWDFGVQGEVEVAASWNLVGSIAVSDDADWTFRVGALMRF